jgi:hypothetical protein
LEIFCKIQVKLRKLILKFNQSQDDTPAINKQQHQQQQYIKKQATNPNTSHSQPPPAQQASRQTIGK